jgi:hypothetical protein
VDRLPRALAGVIPAVAGDYVPRGIWRDDVPVIIAHQNAEHVKVHCGEALALQDYLCISCKQYLKNQTQLELHTETGKHLIARVCLIHGAEEP